MDVNRHFLENEYGDLSFFENKYGPILSVEQETIVENVNLASNRDYNHAVAPKQTWDPSFLFQNLSSYNINNQ